MSNGFQFPTQQLPDGCIIVAGTGQSEKMNALIGLLLTIASPHQSWDNLSLREAICFLKSDRCRQIFIADEEELISLLTCMANERVLSLTGDKIVINVSRIEAILYEAKISWYRL